MMRFALRMAISILLGILLGIVIARCASPAVAQDAPPTYTWLDSRRALLTVHGASELSLRRGRWESPTLLTTDGPTRIVLPDDVGGPRDAGWTPRPGDVWCSAAGCSEALDGFRWRLFGPVVNR